MGARPGATGVRAVVDVGWAGAEHSTKLLKCSLRRSESPRGGPNWIFDAPEVSGRSFPCSLPCEALADACASARVSHVIHLAHNRLLDGCVRQ